MIVPLPAAPAARPRVPHSRPCLGPDEEAAARRVLRSGRLAPGGEAARCEALLARAAGGADAVAVASGTLALTLALRALGCGPRDGVALPSYGCAALLHAVRAAGCRPVPCDIEPAGLSLDPEDLARRPPVRAVVLVHAFGLPARLDPFRARGLITIEDCAQAIGASDRGAPIGARGDAAVFSFGPTKPITCGGPGGGIASPAARVARAVRDLASHDENDADRPRVNGLMGDLHAAIAAVQIGRLPEFRARRAAIAARYDAAFPHLVAGRPSPPAGAVPMAWRYLLRVPEAQPVIEALNRRGVGARRPVFRPLHRLLGVDQPFPHTDRAHAEIVSLPLYPALDDEDVDHVIREVLRCLPSR